MRTFGDRIPMEELRDDRALGAEIRRRYYESSVDVLEAALLEFVPTSVHRSWLGKYRCFWCRSTGYIWVGATGWKWWWGHTHGRNCRKRP